jgi:signal transduction histidine kinase
MWLRQGLFHLIGFVLGSGGSNAAFKIELAERGADAALALTVRREGFNAGPSTTNSDQDLSRRLGLGIARAIFEAAGGSLSVERGAEGLSVEVRLLRHQA